MAEARGLIRSNLPLIFAKGKPKSLESLNLEELRRFLLFLLECTETKNRKIKSLDDLIEKPDWWPTTVEFDSKILDEPSDTGPWALKIRKVIRNCYIAKKALNLIDYSGKLMIHSAKENVTFQSHPDGTRTLTNTAGKTIATFRAENQDYDLGKRPANKLRNGLLPPSTGKLKRRTCSSDPRLPAIEDVYLCDTCDRDFSSLEQVLEHEKLCNQERIASEEEKKASFINYLRLHPKGDEPPAQYASPVKSLTTKKQAKCNNLAKFMSIALTSPLGQYILSNQTSTNVRPLGPGSYNAIVVKRDPAGRAVVHTVRTRKKKISLPVHTYCFTKEQREERQFALRTGLSRTSYQLWQKCQKRRVTIRIPRLRLKVFPVLRLKKKLDSEGYEVVATQEASSIEK